jgi:hypothetical protein
MALVSHISARHTWWPDSENPFAGDTAVNLTTGGPQTVFPSPEQIAQRVRAYHLAQHGHGVVTHDHEGEELWAYGGKPPVPEPSDKATV